MKKRFLTILLALAMALALVPTAALAAETVPVSSTNINAQEYANGRRWAKTVKSYLYENTSGALTRVEYVNNQVIAEDYNDLFQLLSSRTLPVELPIWGGFFAGKDYNFLMFGQDNTEENDNKEVIRIVKYSKDWQRLGSASLYGANTTKPFDAGSARFAEYNGYLYVRTCHEMYTSSDGLNHQANVMINVRQSDMKITDSFTEIMNVSYGYVSHSFNQFVLVDREKRIITLDHGDAGSTRAAVLLRYSAKAGQDSFMEGKHVPAEQPGWYYTVYVDNVSVRDFPAAAGHYNDTGAALGGLAETSNGYVTAYNFDGTASNLGTDPRDVYLAFTDNQLSSTTTVKLSSGTDTSVPVLASTGLNGGYVMWNGRTGSSWYSSSFNNTLSYVRYDASGKTGTVQTATAALSDCGPIFWNGKVVWYVTNNSAPTFYALDSSGVAAHTATVNTAAPANVAHPTTQTVTIDGKQVTFQTYSLKDEKGNDTNYIKIRDLALVLKGTPAQFNVGKVNGVITFTSGGGYTPDGSENKTPYSGQQSYTDMSGTMAVNGKEVFINAFQITHNGGGYTYFKLGDMGQKLNFNIYWKPGVGIVIETDKPYTGK